MSLTPHIRVHLSSEERAELLRIAQSMNWTDRVRKRALILLLSDRDRPVPEGAPPRKCPSQESIARALKVNSNTVCTICRRFAIDGLDAAVFDKPRAGKFDEEVEEKIVSLVRSTPPAGRPHWTMKLLAEQLVERQIVESISDSIVWQRLKKQGLKIDRAGCLHQMSYTHIEHNMARSASA